VTLRSFDLVHRISPNVRLFAGIVGVAGSVLTKFRENKLNFYVQ
jgi:hypothetical protein